MEKEGIAAEQIRLIHNGKQLNDTESLESAKIEAGVTIHMVRARARERRPSAASSSSPTSRRLTASPPLVAQVLALRGGAR
jgi:hypothetical protein